MKQRSDRQQRPNFILFCTDQQRADFLGCAGHPVLRTPNIDHIATQGGVRFDRCYVASPQCMPNRSTMMTGRMPSVHGVRTNGVPLSQRSNTFVDLMRSEGYRTALVGKSHLQNMLEQPPERTPATIARRKDAGQDEFAEALKPLPHEDYGQERTLTWQGSDYIRRKQNYYGYEHVDLCTMHGDKAGGDYYRWLKMKRYDADSLRGRENALPHDYQCPQAWRTAVPEELYPTRYIQDRAVDWLTSYETRRNEAPFFLMVSFPDPHHPFTPPGKYWDMYRPEDMPLPPSQKNRPSGTPFMEKTRAESRGPGGNEYHAMTATEREIREAMALTCGMMAMIDDAVGAVMQALSDTGLDQETVVLFTSDHGDLMGDHGLLLKGPFHYQGLIRVPLLWRDPQAGYRHMQRCGRLVGTIDLGATILARAGIEPYHGIQGRSLLPLVQNPTAEWQRSIMIEEEQHDGVLDSDGPLRVRTVVTENHRLSIYSGQDWGELYDLANDPHEQRNLWDSNSAWSMRNELLAELAYLQMTLADPSPAPTRLG